MNHGLMDARAGEESAELVNRRLQEDLAVVARLDIVPTILDVVCQVTGMGFSAVARVTEDRWIACAVKDDIQFGLLPGGELQLSTTICNEIRDSGQLVAIDHVAEDEVFCRHPTPQLYGFQSYISAPIRLADGRFFGTLCAIDPKPAHVRTSATIGMFELFASLIGLHLDAQERLRVSEDALSDERARTELRDQFIAVLGHDLRNPLAAIHNSARVLLASPLDERSLKVAGMIERGAFRIAGIIDNVLDFARGRLGGGLSVTRRSDLDLDQMVEQILGEMRTTYPDRTIRAEIDITRPVSCDRSRIGQLFSNLLGNALTHGDPAGPVWVVAHTGASEFVLTVGNHGEPIAPQTAGRLFQPFARAADQRDTEGLGLGLYIAAEVARAHQGTLDVVSNADETLFTFRMPIR